MILLPCGHEVSPSGDVLDACAARSKVGPVMGLRPLLGPPCIPPKHPLRKVFNFRSMARTRGLCCGSFPFSLRCSGDLPPRRVNAIPSFCFGQRPFQPTIMAKLLLKKLRASVSLPSNSLYHCAFPRHRSHHFRTAHIAFPAFHTRHQKQAVASPFLNSPQRSTGDGWCWANLQNTRFSA